MVCGLVTGVLLFWFCDVRLVVFFALCCWFWLFVVWVVMLFLLLLLGWCLAGGGLRV